MILPVCVGHIGRRYFDGPQTALSALKVGIAKQKKGWAVPKDGPASLLCSLIGAIALLLCGVTEITLFQCVEEHEQVIQGHGCSHERPAA